MSKRAAKLLNEELGRGDSAHPEIGLSPLGRCLFTKFPLMLNAQFKATTNAFQPLSVFSKLAHDLVKTVYTSLFFVLSSLLPLLWLSMFVVNCEL